MKRGLDLQLALISLEQMNDETKDKSLAEIMSFIVNTSKKVPNLDATQIREQDQISLLERENQLMEEQIKIIKYRQQREKQLADLSPQVLRDQLELESNLAQRRFNTLEAELAEARQQAKNPQVALILKGLVFSFLGYLQAKKHPLLPEVIARLEFDVNNNYAKQIQPAYKALLQLKEELSVPELHQQFKSDIAINEDYEQLINGLNSLTEFATLKLGNFSSVADAVDQKEIEKLNQSTRFINLMKQSYHNLSWSNNLALNSSTHSGDTAIENSIYSSSPSIDLLSRSRREALDQNSDEVESDLDIESLNKEMAKLSTLSQSFLKSSHHDLRQSLQEENSFDLNNTQFIPGSEYLYYGEISTYSLNNSLIISPEPETTTPMLNQNNAQKVSSSFHTLFSPKPQKQPLALTTPTINEQISIKQTILLPPKKLNNNNQMRDNFRFIQEPKAPLMEPEDLLMTKLEEKMFQTFVTFYDADHKKKPWYRSIASQAISQAISTEPDMHDRLTNVKIDARYKITTWQQVKAYTDRYPETTSATTIRPQVEQYYKCLLEDEFRKRPLY